MTATRAAGSAASGAYRAPAPVLVKHSRATHSLMAAAIVAGLVAFVVAALGIGIRAAEVGTAAVDEPQYLLTAISLAQDGNLDISDERAQGRQEEFHDGVLPVQTSVLDGGRRVSPHDPLLPVLLAPAMSVAEALGVPGWVGAKVLLAAFAGLLAAATTWVLGTRWPVPPIWAGGVAAVAGMSAPLAIYGHQVYPELPAALAVVVAVAAIIPRDAPGEGSASIEDSAGDVQQRRRSMVRAVVLVLAISALPWLSIKYAPVAAALAVVALLRMRRDNPRLALGTLAALGVSGIAWSVAHQVLYGGWTAYATGDHFESTGEFSVVGVTPDYLSRSTRLIGLLVDRDYGIAAWQPAWLLILPAVGFLVALSRHRGTASLHTAPFRRQPFPDPPAYRLHLDVLLAPLTAGLLTATFAALTMHGFWSPGRQIVVVLPLAAMVIAIAGAHLQTHAQVPLRAVLLGSGLTLALFGVAIHAWTLTAGYAGTLTWVGAPDVTPPPPMQIIRTALPDYRELATADWALHFGWVVVALALIASGVMGGRFITRDNHPVASSLQPRGLQNTHHETSR
ncbi:MAG: hypothetical protein WBG57_00325 [Ornithinimicrobium sp.]